MNKASQCACLVFVLAILVATFSASYAVYAQTTQSSYTVNLTYLTVQLSYPSEVIPGDSVTVNLQATARNYLDYVSLAAQIFYADGSSLHQLASATISNSNYMNSGNSLTKQIQFTVPQDAPRTSLIAGLTENVRRFSYSYYYSPFYYNYSSPYCYYYPDYYYYYNGYCGYYYNYNYAYGYAYPSYSYNTVTDSGVAPLSYIKATTPEYVSLQSQYQMVQQQLTQSQAENQQLKQNLQDAQNTIAERNATIANLNQQLNSSQSMSGTLEATTAGLAIIAIVLGVFAVYLHRGRSRAQAAAKTERETKSQHARSYFTSLFSMKS